MKTHYYYNKILRIIKEILDDPDLSDEEKIRILGVILWKDKMKNIEIRYIEHLTRNIKRHEELIKKYKKELAKLRKETKWTKHY